MPQFSLVTLWPQPATDVFFIHSASFRRFSLIIKQPCLPRKTFSRRENFTLTIWNAPQSGAILTTCSSWRSTNSIIRREKKITFTSTNTATCSWNRSNRTKHLNEISWIFHSEFPHNQSVTFDYMQSRLPLETETCSHKMSPTHVKPTEERPATGFEYSRIKNTTNYYFRYVSKHTPTILIDR